MQRCDSFKPRFSMKTRDIADYSQLSTRVKEPAKITESHLFAVRRLSPDTHARTSSGRKWRGISRTAHQVSGSSQFHQLRHCMMFWVRVIHTEVKKIVAGRQHNCYWTWNNWTNWKIELNKKAVEQVTITHWTIEQLNNSSYNVLNNHLFNKCNWS